jgi:hypothetical protein
MGGGQAAPRQLEQITELNMAGESPKETSEEQVEAFIDDLIRDIFNESGRSPESSAMRQMATTAMLYETVFGSERAASRASTLEKVLVAQAFASELADALAPALAEQLAPRLLKAMEDGMAGETASKRPTSASRTAGQGRKTETK